MIKVTPELLISEDGARVTAEAWPRRRSELYEAIIPHEYGGLPPAPDSVEAVLRCDSRISPERSVTYQTYEIRSKLGSAEIAHDLKIWVPEGDGPFPVILDGDGCWRYFDDQTVARVIRRGFIAASFDRTSMAADNPDRYRETGLYRLFPHGTFGALAAWAWGYHRCVDALIQLDSVRPDAIAITGHSRGGKTVLLAGAADERIAVTNPNCSGAGGSGLNHLKGQGAEVIEDFFRSRNTFWFGSGFADFRGRDRELPYDQHFLHALVAPRALLVNEAYGDVWANPPGSYAALRAAEFVYKMLGAGDSIGWSVREGEHAHSAWDYDALFDFVDDRLCDRAPVREFRRDLFPDLEGLLEVAG